MFARTAPVTTIKRSVSHSVILFNMAIRRRERVRTVDGCKGTICDFFLAMEVEIILQHMPHVRTTVSLWIYRPGPEVVKLFSCSTQLSLKFEFLRDVIVAKINEFLRFKSSKSVIYLAHKCNCWHFNIYEQDKFHAQQS